MATATERKFLIAWDNVAKLSTPAASSTANDYDAEYVTMGENWLVWYPGADGSATLTWDLGSPQYVDTFAFAVHHLRSTTGTIGLEYSANGSSWSEAVPPFTPLADAPVWKTLETPQTARYWRVTINSTPASPLGYVFLGESTEMERGHFVGFIPPGLNTDVEVMQNTTRDGRIIGQSRRDHGGMLELELDPITDFWTRNTWSAIQQYAETGTYFIQWDDIDHDWETAYCFPMSGPDKARYYNGVYQETALSSRCVINQENIASSKPLPPPEPPPTPPGVVLGLHVEGVTVGPSISIEAGSTEPSVIRAQVIGSEYYLPINIENTA